MSGKVIVLWDHGRWFSGLPPAEVQSPTGNMNQRAVQALAADNKVYVLSLLPSGELDIHRLDTGESCVLADEGKKEAD